MLDNKPFKDIEKQAKHVIDLLNQEGAREEGYRAEALRARRTAAADCLQVWWPPVPARRRVAADPMRRVSRWA